MDIYNDLKIRKVINADGRMTILGVSTIADNVAEAMKIGGQNYFVMDEYTKAVDDKIAEMFSAPAAHVVNSASAGIAMATAAIVYGDKIHDVNVKVPTKNQIIIPKGHNVDFGAPMEDLFHLVGAKLNEAGYANRCSKEDVAYRIDENTAALYYVVSHHCVQKQMLSLDEMIEVAQEHNLPIMVDCASEEDILKYTSKKIDAIVFSGAKAIEGPTSGIVFGSNNVILNMRKFHKTIGRVMKVGKESIIGIYTALSNYKNKTKKEIEYDKFLEIFKGSKTFEAELNKDSSRELYRVKLSFNSNSKLNAFKLSEALKASNPSIYTRDYFSHQGWIEIDVRSIDLEQAQIIKCEIDKLTQ